METTYEIDAISFSLLGCPGECIVELMMDVKRACFGLEDTRPFAWFFDQCLEELELRKTPELERGFIRPPCEDWTATELADFYRAFHVLSYQPLSYVSAKIVDDLVKLSLSHILCRLIPREKTECFTR